MAHYGILRDQRFEDVDDLRGVEVYGVNDEKLGTIDDVIFDHSTGDIRYIVLKTRGLLSLRKVMISANCIEPYGEEDSEFYADFDRERLDMLLEFKEETLKTEAGWSAYEKEYEKLWTDSSVTYNKVTGRIITPPPTGGRPATTGRPLDLKPEKIGRQDDDSGVASGTGETTLQLKKSSTGGKEDVEPMKQRRVREVMNPIGEEIEIPIEGPIPIEGSNQQGIAEQNIAEPNIVDPGIYRLDPIVETEQGAGPSEPQSINQGRRWNDFQQRLRSVRNRIVVECPRCASQDKAA
jgi:sporulation protein YlmC with PRC-barrel domain